MNNDSPETLLKQSLGDRWIEKPAWLNELLAQIQQPKILWSGKRATLVLMNNQVHMLGPLLEAVQM